MAKKMDVIDMLSWSFLEEIIKGGWNPLDMAKCQPLA